MVTAPRVGVLALQGDVREHTRVLAELGAAVVTVRRPEALAQVRGLDGVSATETLVVLSTTAERTRIPLDSHDEFVAPPLRRSGGRTRGGRGR